MKLKIDYIDNEIIFEDDLVPVLEIENKCYFYRLISDLIQMNSDDFVDEVHYYEDNNEMNIAGKLRIIVDYFNMNLNSKKAISDMTKKLSISDSDKRLMSKKVKEICDLTLKVYNQCDLPLTVNNEVTIADIVKFIKLSVPQQNNVLNNLFLLIDIEKNLNNNTIIILVNVKQYLEKEELLELYKYSVYNKIKLLLIDSQSYGVTIDYEKKLIIDENLNEFLID